jgi:hypothetical protein
VTLDTLALELIEADAVADAFGHDAVRVGTAVCTLRPDIDEMYVNRVLGLGLSEPADAAALDRIAAVYGPVRHTIALAPSARPADLADGLRARGYEPAHAWVKFHRRAADPIAGACALRVERIGAERADDYAGVIGAGFGLVPEAAAMLGRLPGRSGWGCYLAYDGDLPVAAAAVFAAGGAAWLGQATTLPGHRRRGAHSALIAARIAAARAAGAAIVVTETGELAGGRPESSYGNLLRAGFEVAYLRPNYASAPEDAAA